MKFTVEWEAKRPVELQSPSKVIIILLSMAPTRVMDEERDLQFKEPGAAFKLSTRRSNDKIGDPG